MIITLCGENTYARRMALRKLVAAFIQKHGANAVEQFEGASVTSSTLKSQVGAVSLFASERLVIVKRPSENKELYSALPEVIESVPDGTTLVIIDGALDKRTKTYKTLKALKDFHEFALLSEPQLLKWVSAEVAAHGGTISSSTTKQLIERVGNDQWQLASEIQKLVAFQAEITPESIITLVTPNLEVSAFALLDAVLAGRPGESARLLMDLKATSDPYEFFGLLAWQAQALAIISSAPRMSSAELTKQSGLKPFVIQKTQGLATKLGASRVKELARIIAELDMQLKSTGVDPWLLVEQALGKIESVSKK